MLSAAVFGFLLTTTMSYNIYDVIGIDRRGSQDCDEGRSYSGDIVPV